MLVTPCFAEQSNKGVSTNDNGSLSDYEFLLSCGFSKDVLDNLPEENYIRLREMVGDNEVEVVHSTSTSQMARGAIDAKDLKVYMDVALTYVSGTNTVAGCIVTASWVWAENKPINKLNEDGITVNWSSEYFNLANFMSQDWYKTTATGEEIVAKEYETPALANQGGIGFYTKPTTWKPFVGGGMLLYLENSIPMYRGDDYSSTINLEYAHDYSVGIGGFSFGAYDFSIGIDFKSMCDSTARYDVVYFNK